MAKNKHDPVKLARVIDSVVDSLQPGRSLTEAIAELDMQTPAEAIAKVEKKVSPAKKES